MPQKSPAGAEVVQAYQNRLNDICSRLAAKREMPQDSFEVKSLIGEYEFVITSYPLLRRDIAHYKEFEFSYCFIDEAQHIKNPKTMNARSVKKINAEHKFALTGTPIENSLLELWSIFDFVMPDYLCIRHTNSETDMKCRL